MTALTWDQVGERRFETGVERGVLYLSDGRAVAWNGLKSIEEQPARERTSYYLDGVKYLERQVFGDFAASLRAYTYPDEFEEVLGTPEVFDGLSYYDQDVQSFSLAYRTRVGNDVDGVDHGYKLHILFDLTAVPDAHSFEAMAESVSPTEFSWALASIPQQVNGYRYTTHISIDSTKTDPTRLAAIEDLLYGTATSAPSLPSIQELTALFAAYNSLIITDHGDGTWTATDLTNSYITMLDPTKFQIDNADATFLDANTYTISTTTP